jgi:hypothetical protein
MLVQLAVCEAVGEGIRNAFGDEVYEFEPGRQWSEYGVEQQAAIVKSWTLGATHYHNGQYDSLQSRICSTNSPLFRYINGNVRPGRPHARTSSGRSVRALLEDAGHRTIKDMLPPRPRVTWSAYS